MNNRLIWADSIKGWLILLVIIGHCIASIIGNDAANLDYWWCLIYSFHMPAFIAISGYLNYRGGRIIQNVFVSTLSLNEDFNN